MPLALSPLPQPLSVPQMYSHTQLYDLHTLSWTEHALMSLPALVPLPGRPIPFLSLVCVSPKTRPPLYTFLYAYLTTPLHPSLCFVDFFRMLGKLQQPRSWLDYKYWFACLSLSIACEFLEGVNNVIYFYILAERLAHIYPSIEHFLDEWIDYDMLWPTAFLHVYHYQLFKSIKRVFPSYVDKLEQLTHTHIHTNQHFSLVIPNWVFRNY